MRRLAIVWGLLVVLAGCRAEGSEPRARVDPTVAAAPTTTHPLAVPEVIDEAYVNRLLAAFDQALGDAFRAYVAAGGPTPEVEERVRAVVDGDLAISVYSGFDVLFALLTLEAPGNPVSEVEFLDVATADCIHARVLRHIAPQVGPAGGEPFGTWLGIERLAAQGGLGNSGWIIVSSEDPSGDAVKGGPCGAE